ncbi:unnamed protein product, partial [Phaedon cochleariae]
MKPQILLGVLLCSHSVFCKDDEQQRNELEDPDDVQYSSKVDQKRQSRRSDRYGPVTFSENPEDNAEMNSNRFVTITKKQNKIRTDGNQRDIIYVYPKVTKKHRNKQNDRYYADDRVGDSSPRLYQALAKHGAKVLRVPPEKLGKDHISLSRDNMKRNNYAFFYKVVDQLTGDDFSHSQIRHARVTNGEYRVKLPDGRLQIVSYRADKNGYKADVRYTGNDAVESENEGEEKLREKNRGSPIQIDRNIRPIPQQIDFSGRRKDATAKALNSVNALKARLPTDTSPQSYEDYEGNLVLPTPVGHPAAVDGNLQVPLPINVKIYTTNARDHSIGSYIPFLANTTPYRHKNINDYQQGRISPRIISNGDHGIVVPIPTPSSFILADQYGQVIDNIRLVTSTALPLVTTPTSYVYPSDGRPYIALRSTVA